LVDDRDLMGERPKVLKDMKTTVKTLCGDMDVIVTHMPDGRPREVFISMGKNGQCTTCLTETLGRMISTSLRYGVPISVIADQLKGVKCGQPVYDGKFMFYSCVDAVAYVLSEMHEEGTNEFTTTVRLSKTTNQGGV